MVIADCPLATATAPIPPIRFGDAHFEHIGGWVHQPSVDVAEFYERKRIPGVFGIAKPMRGGLVDGHSARARGRVRNLPPGAEEPFPEERTEIQALLPKIALRISIVAQGATTEADPYTSSRVSKWFFLIRS